MVSASYRNRASRKRLLWAAGAMIAVAFVCQGVAMAQGVAAGYAAPNNTQYAATGDPTVGGTPAIAPAPAPLAGPPAAAGFQGPVNQDAVNAMVDQRLKEIEEPEEQQVEQQKQCADQQGYVVGSNLASRPTSKTACSYGSTRPTRTSPCTSGPGCNWTMSGGTSPRP